VNFINMNWLRNFPIPEYHLALLVIGLGLHFWSSTAVVFTSSWVHTVVGGLFVITALLMSIWSTASFGRETTVKPDTLRTGGPYKLTRNPMYLSWTMALLGAGLIAGSWWLLAFVPFAMFATQLRVIANEEKFLLERFGTDYEAYLESVPRWFWPL
jgi:protein-S-isoprenylcysteine O-methyltransferase Ste14